jgi:ParB-like chromosome segregation protein Spo0J
MANDYSAKIEWRDIRSILPYSLNAKRHPETQVSKIAAAIAEFGFDQPIVVDSDGVIIKGHGRLEACLKLGIASVPVLVRTDLTPAQVRAARIADNKVAESDYDLDALVVELKRLDEEDFDLSLTGFDTAEIDALFADPSKDEAPPSSSMEIDPDDFEMQSRCPKCGFEFDPK